MANKPLTKVESQNESFNLGATFDNIFLSDKDDFTLKDLYDYLKTYFEQDMFISYSKKEPTADNINIWYDTNEQIV